MVASIAVLLGYLKDSSHDLRISSTAICVASTVLPSQRTSPSVHGVSSPLFRAVGPHPIMPTTKQTTTRVATLIGANPTPVTSERERKECTPAYRPDLCRGTSGVVLTTTFGTSPLGCITVAERHW